MEPQPPRAANHKRHSRNYGEQIGNAMRSIYKNSSKIQNEQASTRSDAERATFSDAKDDFRGFAPIHSAAIKGDSDEMADILKQKGLDVDIPDRNDERTALQWAARLGHDDITKALLDKRASIKRKDKDEKTALHWAATEGRETVVKLLLDQDKDGDSIGLVDRYERTALHWAAMRGHAGVVGQLILKKKKQGFVDAPDQYGRTALIWAAMEGYREIVDKIIDVQSHVWTKDIQFGRTALHWACCKGHQHVARSLINNGRSSTSQFGVDMEGRTVLHLAADQGDAGVVQVLLDDMKELDLSATDKLNRTPLHYAAERGHIGVLKLLLCPGRNRKGARVDKKDDYGWTPLWGAAAKGHEEVIEVLLENKASVTVRDKKGQTPVHAAAQNGQAKVVNRLLKENRDALEAEDNGGSTPLQAAAAKEVERKTTVDCLQDKTALETLLDLKADANKKDKKGRTALHWAAREGNPLKLELLLQNKRDLVDNEKSTEKFGATYWAVTGFADAVKKEKKFMAEEDRLATLYWKPEKRYQKVLYLLLSYAAYRNSDALGLLLREISSTDVKDVVGQIAVRFAIDKEDKELLKLVVEAGVGLGLKDYKIGQTVLHSAVQVGDHTKSKDMVQVLLEHNAPIYSKDNRGRTVLHTAAEKGNAEAVKELLAWLSKNPKTMKAPSKSSLDANQGAKNAEMQANWVAEFKKMKDGSGKTAAQLAATEEVAQVLQGPC